jgi:hypothetical protein
MQFGESLARMVADIANGHEARKVSAGARASAVSALSAATQRTVSAHAAHRKVVASDLSSRAAELRRGLAEADAALDARVRHGRVTARQNLAEMREVIAASATALHTSLGRSRRDAATAVSTLRSGIRSDQAANAAALAASLGQFVAGMRSNTAQIQHAVQAQLRTARAAWGKAAAPRPDASVE